MLARSFGADKLCFSSTLSWWFTYQERGLGVGHSIRDGLVVHLRGKLLFLGALCRYHVRLNPLRRSKQAGIIVGYALLEIHLLVEASLIYNARQLALKLIANVTYGYTAVGFSGRLPCAELADSIVQCGRRTLEATISFVNAHEKWNVKVVYGDTDSMFVLLKGRTWKKAFVIGQEIASAITTMNPDLVTLKMEKVYQGCFLLTKKRYVGYS